MDWISVKDYLPGTEVKHALYRFDDGTVEVMDTTIFNPIGRYKHRDGSLKYKRTAEGDYDTFVTHWAKIPNV